MIIWLSNTGAGIGARLAAWMPSLRIRFNLTSIETSISTNSSETISQSKMITNNLWGPMWRKPYYCQPQISIDIPKQIHTMTIFTIIQKSNLYLSRPNKWASRLISQWEVSIESQGIIIRLRLGIWRIRWWNSRRKCIGRIMRSKKCRMS